MLVGGWNGVGNAEGLEEWVSWGGSENSERVEQVMRRVEMTNQWWQISKSKKLTVAKGD